MSDRERLLNTVRLHSDRFQALWQLATNRAKSDEEKTQLMLRLALDSLDMDTVWVSESVGEWVILRQVADTLGLFHEGMEFLRSDALCQIALSAKKSIYVSDLAVDEQMHTHPIVVQMGLHGYASVPIWIGEHIFGTLVFLKREPLLAGFNKDDQAFMELLAAWLGQTLVQRQQREILESMAMTDSLTRLQNRRAAEIRFNEEIARAKRTGEIFSIAICDLDRFKLINDHYGHAVGDEVLRQVASIMKSALRDGDWMARWGGEEFIVYLHHSDSEQAYVAMDRLRLAINTNPLTTREGGLRITASIGIGVLHSGEGDIARVLSEADGCLYEAKRSGRDRVVVSAHVGHGTLWKAGMLQHALQENRIIPSYQIMVDLKTHEVVADEALARLVQSDGSLIVANDFIEAAEGINLVHAVDAVITRKAMQRCAAERDKNVKSKAILHFVNLSPQFLARKDLMQELLKNSEDDRLRCNVGDSSTKSIVLEITERQFISDFGQLRSDLKPLLDQGFRLALDDFGSGYSSFLYLAELPISFLKIEGWMVQNMRDNPRVLSMVQSIVVLAQKQGITTIAECIEDLETAEMLRDMGVDWGQGYYFGRPECEAP